MQPYFQSKVFPGPDTQSDDKLLGVAREWGTTIFHIVRSYRMGPESDPTAVVDENLSVHELEGLRVVDASIMPNMPSANINAATIMIAEKASSVIPNIGPPAPVTIL